MGILLKCECTGRSNALLWQVSGYSIADHRKKRLLFGEIRRNKHMRGRVGGQASRP